jgi:uncharacterized protein YecT (DUF1311 family)
MVQSLGRLSRLRYLGISNLSEISGDTMIGRHRHACFSHDPGRAAIVVGTLEFRIGRALQDYAEAVRLNPSHSTAAANHKDVAQEIERLGSLSYQKNLPSFNCATAKRQVEKAICADPGLAQLDRNINDVFLRVIASAESDSHRAALALTRQQRGFIEKRNGLFGKRGYDLRQAMEDRLEKLNTIARQQIFAEWSSYSSLISRGFP